MLIEEITKNVDIRIELESARNEEINEICNRFSSDMIASSAYWTRNRKAGSAEKVLLDNFIGKKSEFLVYEYLKNTSGFPEDVLPDISIKKSKDKNWDADLPYAHTYPGKFPNVHVKACSKQYGGRFSWTFQYNNASESWGRDQLFKTGDDNDLVACVILENPYSNTGIIKAILPWGFVKNNLEEPVIPRFRGLKKCFYESSVPKS